MIGQFPPLGLQSTGLQPTYCRYSKDPCLATGTVGTTAVTHASSLGLAHALASYTAVRLYGSKD
eukprot:COSAG01_NODE_62364_length_285_cov_0.548387_1_plen_63_part_10